MNRKLFFYLLLLPCFFWSCSTTNKFEGESWLNQESGLKNPMQAWYFEHLRKATIYYQFSTILTIEAIPRNREYWTWFAKQNQIKQGWNDEQYKERLQEWLDQNVGMHSFLISLYDANRKNWNASIRELGWNFSLQIDDAKAENTIDIEEVSRNEDEYIFYNHTFQRVEPWTKLFVVYFPKQDLEESQTKIQNAVRLFISGLRGKANLVWNKEEIDL